MLKKYNVLTKTTKWLIYLYMLTALTSIFSMVKEYQLLTHIDELRNSLDPEAFMALAAANDFRQLVTARVELLTWIVTGIFILCWIYRSNKNLKLARKPMTFSPGWSVGWYFIPVLCLFKPYHVMQEIVQQSQNAKSIKGMQSENLVGFWWILLIVSGFVGKYASMSYISAKEIENMISANQIGIISEALVLVNCLALLKLINQVYQMQYNNPDLSTVLNNKKTVPVIKEI